MPAAYNVGSRQPESLPSWTVPSDERGSGFWGSRARRRPISAIPGHREPAMPVKVVIAATRDIDDEFYVDPDVDIDCILNICHDLVVAADVLPGRMQDWDGDGRQETKAGSKRNSAANNTISRYVHLPVRGYIEQNRWPVAKSNAFMAYVCLKILLKLCWNYTSKEKEMHNDCESSGDLSVNIPGSMSSYKNAGGGLTWLFGYQGLKSAVLLDQLESGEILLANGATVDASGTALDAAIDRNPRIAKVLFNGLEARRAKTIMNTEEDVTLAAPCQYPLGARCVLVVTGLLDLGADMSIKNRRGDAALHMAYRNALDSGDFCILHKLLGKGSGPNQVAGPEQNLETALYIAFADSDRAAMRQLLDAGVKYRGTIEELQPGDVGSLGLLSEHEEPAGEGVGAGVGDMSNPLSMIIVDTESREHSLLEVLTFIHISGSFCPGIAEF
ncbi:hypothetical protein NM208_g13113 [Fusarium decemcellulare]|uniref:Uncharacterized protein n=1 Tax=Fusarium decemcellulare TaxID=57161 RepID=A0ACC1RPK2_9HYPO|nr:hypothetical protein NM208_g13113 [Fusarium decemcellulare]